MYYLLLLFNLVCFYVCLGLIGCLCGFVIELFGCLRIVLFINVVLLFTVYLIGFVLLIVYRWLIVLCSCFSFLPLLLDLLCVGLF